jgi:4-amino-4-deoxy-L-arabinose transferase-like glycosyltransferase
MPTLICPYCAVRMPMRQFFLQPRSVVLIVVVAIGLRLGAGSYLQWRLPAGQQFELGDSHGYWKLAECIATGKPYYYAEADAQVFRMPGYPTLLAPIFLVVSPSASPMWGRAFSAVFGGITAALVVWWSTMLFDLRAGLIAGWITAVYPGAVAMGAFVLSEAPFMPLMATHLALATAAFKAGTARNGFLLSLAAGLAAAGAVYMRPSWLLFVPFAGLVGILRFPNRWRIAGQSTVALAVICLCLVPWWVRNYRVTGHFVVTTLQVGASLYDGLNLNASGGSNMNFSLGDVLLHHNAYHSGAELDEFALNRDYREMAMRWATENPILVIKLVGIKFSRLWNVIPNEPMFRSWPLKLSVALTFTPLMALGLYGLMKFSPRGWPFFLAGLPALYFTLLHVIFVAGIRYREPAMLGLIVLASGIIADRFQTKAHGRASTR